jgi:ATP-dependent DNA ligase
MPGAPSRWNAKKDMRWEPLRIELVAEVAYEHLQGDRFRHTARFQRWRHDRDPASCTYDQLEVPVPHELAEIFGL